MGGWFIVRIMTTRGDRIEAGLLGLLIGDALGVPYEFHGAQDIPARELIELEPPAGFRRAHASVPPGTWSDDGAQALCLLASLLERGALELRDFAERMLRWWQAGYMAVDGHVFDIGIQTQTAFVRLANDADPRESGPAGEYDNGNGSLMRVLPLALWHRGDDRALVEDAMASSLPTHGHLRSQLCCALYCLWARRVLDGLEVDAAWASAAAGLRALVGERPGVAAELAVIDPEREPGGGGSGYVVDCLHSARLALTAERYEDVVRAAIALGNDTDTTAAVAGGIAGLRSGPAGLPERWVDGLRGRELLDPLLRALFV
jgi:ADP-ribosyl-[dinitrogen reductase] hydrolase